MENYNTAGSKHERMGVWRYFSGRDTAISPQHERGERERRERHGGKEGEREREIPHYRPHRNARRMDHGVTSKGESAEEEEERKKEIVYVETVASPGVRQSNSDLSD